VGVQARNHVGLGWHRSGVKDSNALVGAAGGEHGGLVGRPLDVFDGGRVAGKGSLVDEPATVFFAFHRPAVDAARRVAGGQLAWLDWRPVDGEAFGLMAIECEERKVLGLLFSERGHRFGIGHCTQWICQIPYVDFSYLRPTGCQVLICYSCTLEIHIYIYIIVKQDRSGGLQFLATHNY